MLWKRISPSSRVFAWELLSTLYITFSLLSYSTLYVNALSCSGLPSLSINAASGSFSPPSVCLGVLPYSNVSTATACLSGTESNIAGFPAIWGAVSSQCRQVLAPLMCGWSYQDCTNPNGIPCQSACVTVASTCNPYELAFVGAATGNQFTPYLNCSNSFYTSAAARAVCNANLISSAFTPLVPLPSCQTYTGAACAGVSDSAPVYIPAGVPVAALESIAQQVQLSFSLAAASPTCENNLARFVCGRTFLGCNAVPAASLSSSFSAAALPGNLSLPRLPCQSVCTDYQSSCAFLYGAVSSLAPNCSSVGSYVGKTYTTDTAQCGAVTNVGQPDFPTSSTNIGGIPVQCNALSTAHAVPECAALPTKRIDSNAGTISPASVCLGVLPYSNVSTARSCLSGTESSISSFPTLWAAVSDTCREVLAPFMCGFAYQPCGLPLSTPCQSACLAVTAAGACTVVEIAFIKSATNGLFDPYLNCYSSFYSNPQLSLVCNANLLAAAGTPTVPIPSCETYSGTACLGVSDASPVYVPAGVAQTELESLAQSMQLALPLAGTQTCANDLARFVCTKAFMACESLPAAALSSIPIPDFLLGNLSLPRLPAQSLCTDYKSSCAAFYSAVPALAPNCSGVGNILGKTYSTDITQCGAVTNPGLPDYPVATFTVAGVTVQANVASGGHVVPQCALLQSKITNPGTGVLQPPSVCLGVLPYSNVSVARSCLSGTESQVNSLPVVWNAVSPKCRQILAPWMCGFAYQPCGNPDGTPCVSSCLAVNAACSVADLAFVATATQHQFDQYLNCSSSFYANPLYPYVCNANLIPAGFTPVVPLPTCQPYTSGACSGVSDLNPNGLVYIPAGFTASDLEFMVSSLQFVWAVSPIQGDCYNNNARYMCSRIFMACEIIPAAVILPPTLPGIVNMSNVVLPRQPCQSTCQAYAQSCAPVYGANPALAPNCSSLGGVVGKTYSTTVGQCGVVTNPGLPDFPVAASNIGGFPVECFAPPTSGAVVALANVNCPFPLVFLPTALNVLPLTIGGDSPCATPCLNLVYNDSDYLQADYTAQSLAWMSGFASLFMLATWIVFEKKRKQRLVLIFTSIIFEISWMYIGHVAQKKSGHHVAQIGCDNAADRLMMFAGNSGWCMFFAVMQTFMTEVGTFWWMLSAVDLYMKVCWNFRPPEGSRQNVYRWLGFIAVGWGIPIILMFIAVGQKTFGQSDGGCGWCGPVATPDYPVAEWGTFYYPMIIAIAVGTFCALSTLFELHKTSMATSTSSTMKRKGKWRRYVRTLVFILVFWILYGFIVGFRAYYFFGQDTWMTSAQEWLTCNLLTKPTAALSGITLVCDGDAIQKPPQHPSVVLFVMIHISIAGCGLLNFLIYGTMKENFQLWAGLIGGAIGNKTLLRFADTTVHSSSGRSHEAAGSKQGSERHSTHPPLSPAGSAKPLPFSAEATNTNMTTGKREGSRAAVTTVNARVELPNSKGKPPHHHNRSRAVSQTNSTVSSAVSRDDDKKDLELTSVFPRVGSLLSSENNRPEPIPELPPMPARESIVPMTRSFVASPSSISHSAAPRNTFVVSSPSAAAGTGSAISLPQENGNGNGSGNLHHSPKNFI